MTPKSADQPIVALAGRDDEKVGQIMNEVDRFFKSVHAEIEDWKFSMEDYGDGTRIFVRFQIHVNRSGLTPNPAGSKGKRVSQGTANDRTVTQAATGGRTLPDGRAVTENPMEPGGTAAAQRHDQDLASFVEQWRGKKASATGGEFHKEGAPFLDAKSTWKGHTRSSEEDVPHAAGAPTPEPATPRTSSLRARTPVAAKPRRARRTDGETRTPSAAREGTPGASEP
jgi:hypothetical protein